MFWQEVIKSNNLTMLKTYYIPRNTQWLGLQNNVRIPEVRKGLADMVENIIMRWYSQNYLPINKKFAPFINRVLSMMGVDYEDSDYLSPASMMSYMPQAIQLFLSMWFLKQNKMDEILLQEWRNTVNDSDSTLVLWVHSVYEIFQSSHWDVTLKRIDNKQGDMFWWDWMDITDILWEHIRAYQETTPLVAALLMWYYYWNWDVWKLRIVLSSLEWVQAVWCSAWDSETKETTVKQFILSFRRINTEINDFWINITASTDISYWTKFDPINNQVLFWEYERRKIGNEFNTVLAIPIADIPQILWALCKFSWRSGDGWRMLIQGYISNFWKC